MPPKKAQKMSLNEFLEDSTLGSWADEMDSLPTAPAARSDDDDRFRSGMGGGRRDDYMSSRPDRGPPREDLPLPTEPPFTAFVGNLAFDLTEGDLEAFFTGFTTKSVKIIKDRDERPKGFGYVEFAELDGLKDALTKSGTSLAGRTVRISVAEPPKERSGFGGSGGFDDEKFAGNWRRDGPLPDLPGRDGSRGGGRRYDSGSMREPPPPSFSDNVNDWRSSRPPARAPPMGPPDEGSGFRRRGSDFRNDGPVGPADTEDNWSRGSRFKPSGPPEGTGSRFGGVRGGRGEFGAPNPEEEGDWRRPRTVSSRNSTSPGGSIPSTPQMGRRKLELLPRSSANSGTPSPLASPNPAQVSHQVTHQKSNPFGDAKPVDTLARENVIEERLEKEREEVKERVSHHMMSRTSSHTASHRGEPRTGHPAAATEAEAVSPTSTPASPKPAAAATPTSPKAAPRPAPAANVRPAFSFANAAAAKKDAAAAAATPAAQPAAAEKPAAETEAKKDDSTEKLAEKVADVKI